MKSIKGSSGWLPPPEPGFNRRPGWRLWRLRLLALVAPFLVLALLELMLRAAGFGYPTAFLLSSANHGRPTFTQNNQFGWRFFGKRKSRAPYPISIPREKPRGAVRIFVFGESAAFGFPDPDFGLPRVLQAMLSSRHPGTKFEVVNAAMLAINSHVILPIARDCAGAGGDIWVIYMGNNEVVGPFGAGTALGAQDLPLPLVRASLALKTTRLGQLVEAARQAWQEPPADERERNAVLAYPEREVSADDPRMSGVYRHFARNLADIIRLGHESGAGIVLSTVAVNLKDCAPFASRHRADLSGSDKQKWDHFMNLGLQAQSAGRLSEALSEFQAAAQLDDSNAGLEYLLGRCRLAQGDVSGARKALMAARDLDALRLRCDGPLNQLVRNAAAGRQAQRILLADAERAFAAASPDGLPGWHYFYEHVHLTFAGNCLLARTLAEQIERLLPTNATASTTGWPTVADCARRLGRTDRDLLPALKEILGLLANSPYTGQINHHEQIDYLTREARADREASRADALQTVQTALAAAPDDAVLYERLARLQQVAGQSAGAEASLRRAVDLLPSSGYAWSQLGFAFVHQEKYGDAANAFQRAFDLDSQDVWPLQNLAMSMEKLGRNDEAMRDLRRVLAITPRFGPAWLALGQLLESNGQADEAAECYRKAFQNRIPRAADLTTLAQFCMSRRWFKAAVTNYDDAVKLDPSDASLAMEAGQAHSLFGQQLDQSRLPAQAAREFQEAVRLMPDAVEARLNLGIAFYHSGQWNESLAQFEQVAARSPTNAVARHYLALLRQTLAPQGQQ
jgi:tetratricopeptide (TPR) repeat protein